MGYKAMSKHLRVNGGFTLIEMLIVVIILGLISAYVTQHISKIDPKAKEVTLKHNLRSMR